jgi:hypothetical protein
MCVNCGEPSGAMVCDVCKANIKAGKVFVNNKDTVFEIHKKPAPNVTYILEKNGTIREV